MKHLCNILREKKFVRVVRRKVSLFQRKKKLNPRVYIKNEPSKV